MSTVAVLHLFESAIHRQPNQALAQIRWKTAVLALRLQEPFGIHSHLSLTVRCVVCDAGLSISFARAVSLSKYCALRSAH